MATSDLLQYTSLSAEVQKQIEDDRNNGFVNPFRCDNNAVVRRDSAHDNATLLRPSFVRDIEKIIHLPLYNRYADKTQVFSFFHNDDITRRALHVQLVSRIARNIGAILGLNLDLIEAMALGHDIGHTPFGHAGERYLSELLHAETGRYFNHNVQSVRVLDTLFNRNLSLQTLDGILCHNGEFEQQEYRPSSQSSFELFDRAVEACYTQGNNAIKTLVPVTLEGCVVRICDMIAYLGKDRQDARIAGIVDADTHFTDGSIGVENAAIINNLTVDIIEHSYRKPFIMLSDTSFSALKTAKQENYQLIYQNSRSNSEYDSVIRPMFTELFYRLRDDLRSGKTDTIIYRHHVQYTAMQNKYYNNTLTLESYAASEPNQVTTDFIASMTDDYFLALYKELFPTSPRTITFKSYFEDIHTART